MNFTQPSSHHSSSTQWLFDGRSQNYHIFLNKLNQQLANKSLYYVQDKTQVQDMTKAVTPLDLPEDQLTHALKTKYELEVKAFNENKIKVYNDFSSATQILTSLLSNTIINRIRHIITIPNNNPLYNTPQLRFTKALEFLERQYAPNSSVDARKIESRLRTATARNGFRALIDTHYDCQSELDTIIKRDNDGNPITAGEVIQTYKLDSEQMRQILMEQLADPQLNNPHFATVRLMAVYDPNISYEQIIERIELLLKERDIYDNNNSSNRHINSTTSSKITAFSATNNRTVKCINCDKYGHYSVNCPSLICFSCKQTFSNYANYKNHHDRVHKKQNRIINNHHSNQNNNRPINNNLAINNKRNNHNYDRKSNSRSNSPTRKRVKINLATTSDNINQQPIEINDHQDDNNNDNNIDIHNHEINDNSTYNDINTDDEEYYSSQHF
jgi:hypothetical protein